MKIFIELPTWLGDSIMATPAIENIVDSFDDAKITLLGSSAAINALQYHPNVIKTHTLSKKYFSLFNDIRKFEKFDIFISFRSSLRSKFICFFVSSNKKYQFNKKKYKSGHQVEKYNQFINESLDINKIPKDLTLYTIKKNDQINTKKKLLGINPGASYGSAKRWYPDKFAEVAHALSYEYDIIIFGGHNEKDIAGDIERYLIEKGVSNYFNLASKTNVSQLISQISDLDLFITADSGPMHIAAAFNIPTVAIFGPTKDSETSPWMNENSMIVMKQII